MSSILRSSIRVPRARFLPTTVLQPRRFAHSSYGNEQSGHEQGTNQKNPMQEMEHPGPDAPNTEGAAPKGSGGSSGATKQSSSKSTESSSSNASSGGEPTISTPKSAAEDESADVKKHNEEMAQRHDRSVNQLSEKDNKVDKSFWKGEHLSNLFWLYTDHSGDVGDMKQDKKGDSN